jgi:predicted cupin superfamily sugar epimerase
MEELMDLTSEKIIQLLNLEPLRGEGGLFRQTYISSDISRREHLPERYSGNKPFGTAIYYLLTSDPDSFSAMHKLPTDEIWHFYLGDPVEMLELHPDGSSRMRILGQDITNGQLVQHVIPKGIWQGSHLVAGGKFALLGTTMAPGFTPEDYVSGDREALVGMYPSERALIQKLTRIGEC